MSSEGHNVLIVTRPVESTRKKIAKFHKIMSARSQPIGDKLGMVAMFLFQHWAIVVDGNYYHLKRMQDDSLALDITPFEESTIVCKLGVLEVNLPRNKIHGLAVSVISSMLGLRSKPRDIPIYLHGKRVQIDIDLSQYRSWIGAVTSIQMFPFLGRFTMMNLCISFAGRFCAQVMVPRNIREIFRLRKAAANWLRELESTAAAETRRMNSLGFTSVEDMLRHYFNVDIPPQ